jgi:transaldolase
VGADIVTIPPHLIDEMLYHDLTEKWVTQFMEDAKKYV